MTKQQRIVSLLRNEYERANEAYRHAHAEHMGTVAAASAWDDSHPGDGVGAFSQNPYNISRAAQDDENARVYAAQMREAYEFAVDTFIESAAAGGGESEVAHA